MTDHLKKLAAALVRAHRARIEADLAHKLHEHDFQGSMDYWLRACAARTKVDSLLDKLEVMMEAKKK